MSKKPDNYNSSEIDEILKKTKVMTNDFSGQEISSLTSIVDVEIYEAGELILKEDDSSRDLFVVVHGSVSVEINVTFDKEDSIEIKKIRNNTVIGEFSFVDGSRRSANVKASMESTLFRFQFDKLDSLCKSDLNIGYKLMKNLAILMSERLRNANFELRTHLFI